MKPYKYIIHATTGEAEPRRFYWEVEAAPAPEAVTKAMAANFPHKVRAVRPERFDATLGPERFDATLGPARTSIAYLLTFVKGGRTGPVETTWSYDALSPREAASGALMRHYEAPIRVRVKSDSAGLYLYEVLALDGEPLDPIGSILVKVAEMGQ